MRQTGAKKGVWAATNFFNRMLLPITWNATPVSSRVACTCQPCGMFAPNNRDKSTETNNRDAHEKHCFYDFIAAFPWMIPTLPMDTAFFSPQRTCRRTRTPSQIQYLTVEIFLVPKSNNRDPCCYRPSLVKIEILLKYIEKKPAIG